MSLKSEFIILSELIRKLDGNDYYITYAKSLALTENSSTPLPSDDTIIKEMFFYFIRTNELKAFHVNKIPSNSEVYMEDLEDISNSDLINQTNLSVDKIYVRIKDLKKLYANKCIVFPSSLLK